MMRVNQLPAPTWNWLHMNHAETSVEVALTDASYEEKGSSAINCSNNEKFSVTCKTGLGEEYSQKMENLGLPVHSYQVTTQMESPIYQTFSLKEKNHVANLMEWQVAKGASAVVIQDFSEEEAEDQVFATELRYHLQEDARLTVVQILRPSEKQHVFLNLGGILEAKAEFHLIQLVLNGQEVYLGNYTDLQGTAAGYVSDLGYTVKGTSKLDINYVANHVGKKTTADILASGVLRNQGKKLFRGTIDFHKGCAGSKGNELEEVLLMDDDIVNQTIPLILCDEEDVEGSHGASIGQMDDSLALYMKSRGLSEEIISEMLAKAKIDVIINRIPDEKTKEMVRSYLVKHPA